MFSQIRAEVPNFRQESLKDEFFIFWIMKCEP